MIHTISASTAADSARVLELSDLTSQLSIIALVVLCGVLVILAVVRRRPGALAALAAAGAGSVLSYLLSEFLKILVRQPRPCHLDMPSPECPPLDDWSFPSNHAVIAFGLALAVIVGSRRLWVVAVPLALITATGRVLSHEHFVHDVVVGGLIGIIVVALTVLLLQRALIPLADRIVSVVHHAPRATR